MAKGVRGFFAALPLVAASVAFALATAEACLRVFPQLMPEEFQLRRHWQDTSGPVPHGDPYLGYVFPSNYEGRVEDHNGSFAFNFSTDSYGFRNSSPWPRRADIVVLGDSMAFSYGVEDNEAWPDILAEQLPGSRIINLGLMGRRPSNTSGFMRHSANLWSRLSCFSASSQEMTSRTRDCSTDGRGRARKAITMYSGPRTTMPALRWVWAGCFGKVIW